ncbi:NHL repeat-containing protein [Thermodesulfobacteriota bacterium]
MIKRRSLWVLLAVVLATAGVSTRFAHGREADVPVIAARHLFDIEADFLHPSDVAVGPGGHIYVLDGVNNRVMVFDAAGAYVSRFGSKGSGKGGFSSPLGIAIDARGDVYVADSGNSRIQVFDSGGRFRFEFAVEHYQSRSKSDPVDVVVDDERQVCYVVDNENHQVLVYTKDGSRLLDGWGRRGEKPGEFQFPFLAAMDSQSTLYVVDVLNTRVQAINSEGRTMAVVGKWGVDRGQFYRPKGVAIDGRDRIYVSDGYLGVVQVFKRYRTFLGVLGNEKKEFLRFKAPTGMFVDDQLRIYVVEMRWNRVRVYQILE